jgi:single-strand DNA-binding protein
MLSSTVVGRLTRDAEIRTTSNGNAIASFSVASDHGFGDRKSTTFVGVTVFGKDAEFCGKLVKGDRVAASGASYLRKWEANGKAGAEYSIDAHRVEKLWEAREDQQAGQSSGRASNGRDAGRQREDRGHGGPDDDGGIPF